MKGRLLTLVAVLSGFCPVTVLGRPTAQEMQDAILGRQSFTAEQLADMDLNGDGALDAADLVVLGNPVVQANFHSGSSVLVEGTAGAGPTVNFSGYFVGRLRYGLRELPGGALSTHLLVANGTSAIIPLAISDDALVEEPKVFEVTLLEAPGYVLGPRTYHTLVLEDNDAVWNGSYQNGGLSVPIQVKIIRNGEAVSGALVTDGFGIIPRIGDETETQWPLKSMTFSNERFEAEVEGILIPRDATQTGVAMQRGFVFKAEKATSGQVVDPGGTVAGQVTETVTVPTDRYLFPKPEGGTFRLQKRIATVKAPDPVLELAQK